jgi:hypothetical protein
MGRALSLAIVSSVGFLSFGACAATQSAPIQAHPDLSGVWRGEATTSLSPSDRRADKRLGSEADIPYTAWALARIKEIRPASGAFASLKDTNDPSMRYVDPNGYPRVSLHPMRFKLVQTDDAIYQLWEYNQNWRQILLNAAHSADPGSTWYGESVGKWDGATLVVDVVGFNDVTWLDNAGHPHSDELHITERIRRTGDDILVFDLTIEDPVAYTRPWTSQLTFARARDATMTETIYTISNELRFRERFLGEKPGIPIRR